MIIIILQILRKLSFCNVFQKKKGMFHHSSFLAGGATLAAGRLVVEDGTVKVYWLNYRNLYMNWLVVLI